MPVAGDGLSGIEQEPGEDLVDPGRHAFDLGQARVLLLHLRLRLGFPDEHAERAVDEAGFEVGELPVGVVHPGEFLAVADDLRHASEPRA